jgi:hypothetical protein
MVSHIVKLKEVRGLGRMYFIVIVPVFKHILPDILFFMCGGDEGGRYEEFVTPWSGSMAVVMEELFWFMCFE